MSTLRTSILSHGQSLPKGGVPSPKAFQHLGSRAAINQARTRRTKEGNLLQVARGTYVTPVLSRFGTQAAATEKVVCALAAQNGTLVAPYGANAANAPYMTRQAPIREVYLASSRTRKLKLGRSEVTLKRAPRRMLALDSGQAGTAMRAPARTGPSEVRQSLVALGRTLHPSEWQVLKCMRAALPSWMAWDIDEEARRG